MKRWGRCASCLSREDAAGHGGYGAQVLADVDLVGLYLGAVHKLADLARVG